MKRLLLVLSLTLGIAGLSFSLEAGGGISIFVPESLYLAKAGSVGVETNFQYSLGLSKLLSLPIGISWDKIYGYTPGGTAALDAIKTPWFFGDSIMGYAMVKLHLPVSIFYLDLFGGGAANWNASLAPVGQSIEGYLTSTTSGASSVALTSLTVQAPWGYGWLAGAGFGVSVKKLSVDISATYRDVRSPLTVSGNYYALDSSGAVIGGKTAIQLTGAQVIMRGLSVGLTGHFSL